MLAKSQNWNAICIHLTSYTSGDANRVVRNSGDSQGLHACRRLHDEYDPTSNTRGAQILVYVQNPTTCDRIEDLGFALEDLLAQKRLVMNSRIVMGVLGDSLMAAMDKIMPKSLGETEMFKGDEVTFASRFAKLVSFASVKRSFRLDNKQVRTGTRRQTQMPWTLMR